jgi:hypothetical protein
LLYKLTAFAVAGFLGLVVASSADAFFCFNANRSEEGNASAGNGAALGSVDEFLGGEVGLCPAGIEHVKEGLEEAGFPADFVINERTIMAQGLEKNGSDMGQELLHNQKGIDHLDDEFFETAEELIGEAFGLCPP